MKTNDDFQQFLDGGNFPSNEKMNQKEEEFVSAYKNLIQNSNNETIPDFDAFEKVKSQNSRLQIKRLIPYAAVFILLLSIPVLVHLINKKPEIPKFTEAEIMEATKNTAMALAYFSEEWNESLANFNDIKISSQINEEFKSLKEIKIEYSNPIKNLKIDEL